MRHSVGKSGPALSSELGLMLLTAQVVRGSVGSPNVMVGDRLELDACDLELVCTLYLRLSKFQPSGPPAELPHSRKETPVEGRGGGLQAAVHRAKGSKEEDLRPGDRSHVCESSQVSHWWLLHPHQSPELSRRFARRFPRFERVRVVRSLLRPEAIAAVHIPRE